MSLSPVRIRDFAPFQVDVHLGGFFAGFVFQVLGFVPVQGNRRLDQTFEQDQVNRLDRFGPVLQIILEGIRLDLLAHPAQRQNAGKIVQVAALLAQDVVQAGLAQRIDAGSVFKVENGPAVGLGERFQQTFLQLLRMEFGKEMGFFSLAEGGFQFLLQIVHQLQIGQRQGFFLVFRFRFQLGQPLPQIDQRPLLFLQPLPQSGDRRKAHFQFVAEFALRGSERGGVFPTFFQ